MVYIPYDVSSDIVTASYCSTPGVLFADHVILQNENIKRQYEIYYPKAMVSKYKFLALGSPKIEKILSTTIEDVEMPLAWKKLIADRKVILYNTSLGAMFNNPSNGCKKLKFVFEQLRKNQECVLWWRPHPLMKQSLKAMHPDFYEEYCQIEKEYIEAGWGIYDDTPDLDRAIAISDAYYGDGSSVVQLCQKVGMPIMIQNVGILY